jgi:hypothetical protein
LGLLYTVFAKDAQTSLQCGFNTRIGLYLGNGNQGHIPFTPFGAKGRALDPPCDFSDALIYVHG